MKAVFLDVPQVWLDERHRLDLDRKDEMWDGVLHVVPPASSEHNELGGHLMAVLRPLATDRGLRSFPEPGVFDPAVGGMTSYRVGDLGFARPQHVTRRGIEGRASLVVEILSPSDESHAKLAFYLNVGVEELLYVDPVTKAFEIRRPAGVDWAVTAADGEGWVGLASLGVAMRTLGGSLHIRTPDRTERL